MVKRWHVFYVHEYKRSPQLLIAACEMMLDERLWKLIPRKLSGEASPDELNELEELRIENHHVNFYIGIIST